MNDRLLSFLGLCRRAGRLTTGFDAAADAVGCGEARLVIAAEDVSPNTLKKLRKACESGGVDCIVLSRTKEQISFSVGRFAAVAAVCDDGFAKKLRELAKD